MMQSSHFRVRYCVPASRHVRQIHFAYVFSYVRQYLFSVEALFFRKKTNISLNVVNLSLLLNKKVVFHYVKSLQFEIKFFK